MPARLPLETPYSRFGLKPASQIARPRRISLPALQVETRATGVEREVGGGEVEHLGTTVRGRRRESGQKEGWQSGWVGRMYCLRAALAKCCRVQKAGKLARKARRGGVVQPAGLHASLLLFLAIIHLITMCSLFHAGAGAHRERDPALRPLRVSGGGPPLREPAGRQAGWSGLRRLFEWPSLLKAWPGRGFRDAAVSCKAQQLADRLGVLGEPNQRS